MTAIRPAEPSLPRFQSGNTPQLVLAALLADFEFAQAGPVTSSTIVDLLEPFGCTEAASRSALSRVVGRGLLVRQQEGRRVTYIVNPDGLSTRGARFRHYVTTGATDTDWDGAWTIAVFSVPDSKRALRPRLRTSLGRLHMAPLTDAVWVHSSDVRHEAISAADELGVALTAFRSPAHTALDSSLDPMTAFDLKAIRRLYDDFVAEFSPLLRNLELNEVSPTGALVGRISCLNNWRRIVGIDPDLPTVLLPPDWPRRTAYSLFSATWRGLGPLALSVVKEIVGRREPETARRLECVE